MEIVDVICGFPQLLHAPLVFVDDRPMAMTRGGDPRPIMPR
jgi:hypothetical protein